MSGSHMRVRTLSMQAGYHIRQTSIATSIRDLGDDQNQAQTFKRLGDAAEHPMIRPTMIPMVAIRNVASAMVSAVTTMCASRKARVTPTAMAPDLTFEIGRSGDESHDGFGSTCDDQTRLRWVGCTSDS
jgi:hypothetical protein